MIPRSTNATVELSGKIPARAGAVTVLMKKDATPGGVDVLSEVDRGAVDALLAAKAATGRANEVAAQAVTQPSPHSVLVVGIGAAAKVTAQSLREAGAAI